MNDCVFCNLDESRIEIENDLALSFKDLYPVTNGHTLVIPKRKVQSFFDLTEEETAAMFELLHLQKEDLKNKELNKIFAIISNRYLLRLRRAATIDKRL